jgi:hypothetical protein
MLTNEGLILFKEDERFRNVALSISEFDDNPLKYWTYASIVLDAWLDSDEGQWLSVQTPEDNTFRLRVKNEDNNILFSLDDCRVTAKEIKDIIINTPDELKRLTVIVYCSCYFKIHTNV